MAKYTIELRELCNLFSRETVENWFKDYQLSDFLTSKQIETIENCGIWSKDKLAKKIVDHFYMREIGFETHTMFIHYVKSTINEIMSEFLPIIYTNSIEFDPLINVDFVESFNREITGNSDNKSNSNTSNNSNGLSVNSDTPQGNINKQAILNGAYASSTHANDVNSSSNDSSNSSSNSNTIEKYTRTQKGNSGSLTTAQALIQQYRDIIVNVDLQIINRLSQLFMSIY